MIKSNFKPNKLTKKLLAIILSFAFVFAIGMPLGGCSQETADDELILEEYCLCYQNCNVPIYDCTDEICSFCHPPAHIPYTVWWIIPLYVFLASIPVAAVVAIMWALIKYSLPNSNKNKSKDNNKK